MTSQPTISHTIMIDPISSHLNTSASQPFNTDSDVTRLLSASVYENYEFRTKLIDLLDNPCRSVADSFGVDTEVVLKHAIHAKEKNASFYYKLAAPAAVFIISLLLYVFTDLRIPFLIPFLSYCLIFVMVYLHKESNIKFLKENFSTNANNAVAYVSELNHKPVQDYVSRICKNIVYYSGYSPFVGSGYDNGGWSFVVDTTKGKQSFNIKCETIPFTQDEFYSFIDKGISSLDIKSLRIEDKIFVNGKKIRSNKNLLNDILSHPVTSVSEAFISSVRKNNMGDFRFYKVFQAIEWGGDIVITAYFRVHQDEKHLFVENNYFVLPPIDDKYKTVDSIKDQSGTKYILKRIREAFFSAFSNSFISLSFVIDEISSSFSGNKKRKEIIKEVKESPDYNYGAETSIREQASQYYYKQFFQKLDRERLIKIINKTIFDLIADFLDSKNIDTTEFKERESSILNQGVIVNGGNVTAENISVGSNAKITSRIKQAISNEK